MHEACRLKKFICACEQWEIFLMKNQMKNVKENEVCCFWYNKYRNMKFHIKYIYKISIICVTCSSSWSHMTHFCKTSEHAGGHLVKGERKWNKRPQWPLVVACNLEHKTEFLTCCSQRAVHLPWHGVSVVPQLDWTAKVTQLNQAWRCQKDVGAWKNKDRIKSW